MLHTNLLSPSNMLRTSWVYHGSLASFRLRSDHKGANAEPGVVRLSLPFAGALPVVG